MRNELLFSGLCAVLILLFSSFSPADDNSAEVIEQIGAASINWSEGFVEASGTGKVPDAVLDKPNAYVLALETAKVNAARNLLEMVKAVRVDALTEIRDLMRNNEALRSEIESAISKLPTIQRTFSYSQKRVKVVFRIALKRELTKSCPASYPQFL